MQSYYTNQLRVISTQFNNNPTMVTTRVRTCRLVRICMRSYLPRATSCRLESPLWQKHKMSQYVVGNSVFLEFSNVQHTISTWLFIYLFKISIPLLANPNDDDL